MIPNLSLTPLWRGSKCELPHTQQPPTTSKAHRARTKHQKHTREMRATKLMMAGHGPRYIRHAPPLPPNVGVASKVISKTIGAIAIFWILYRCKNDGMVMLGLKHPWDH